MRVQASGSVISSNLTGINQELVPQRLRPLLKKTYQLVFHKTGKFLSRTIFYCKEGDVKCMQNSPWIKEGPGKGHSRSSLFENVHLFGFFSANINCLLF